MPIQLVCDACGRAFTRPPSHVGAWNACSLTCRDVVRANRRIPLAERFWPKVNKDGPVPEQCPELGPCWLWTGGRHDAREALAYGRLTLEAPRNGKRTIAYAHRIAWELTNGPLPKGAHLLHTCDRPICCNPAHLSIGDQRANNADRDAKGRVASGDRSGVRVHPERFPRGEQVPWAKLTDAQASAIRVAWQAGGVSQAGLARLYRVHQSHISRLVRGLVRKPAPV